MSRQFSFALSLRDSQKFESQLLGIEDSVVVYNRSRGPYPRVYSAEDELTEPRCLFMHLVRRADLDRVVTKEVPTQGYWCLEELISPVIELTRSTMIDGVLARGRLYYHESYYDEASNPVRKHHDFCAWAKKVFSKAKRMLTYDRERELYFGEEAMEMCDSGVPLRNY